MKIAVLSDIHGNLLALESVLEDLTAKNCEKILLLGDYALAGPEPADVINFLMLLKEKQDLEFIQGNTDEMIVEYSDKIYKTVKKGAPIMAEALKYEVETLSANQKQFLKNLPKTKELEIDGIKILMVHGSPRKNNEDIMPDTPIEKLEEMISSTDANLILCGHTHLPCGFQTNTKQTVVNVGSVGRPFTKEPLSCYAIITTKGNGEFVVEHNFVEYNNIQAANTLSRRDFKGADKLSHTLIHPEHRHM